MRLSLERTDDWNSGWTAVFYTNGRSNLHHVISGTPWRRINFMHSNSGHPIIMWVVP